MLVRLTPKRGMLRGVVWSILLVTVPVLGVLFFLGLGNGSWPIALAGFVLSAGLCLIGYSLYRSTFIGVTTTTIEERGFWGGTTSARRADVASIVLAKTYTAAAPDPVPQLIVRSTEGSRMLRMRGIYWTLDDMRSVVVALDASPSLPIETMTTEEFFTRYPGSAYWFERRPLFRVLVAIAGFAVGAAAILGIMRLLGFPIDGH
jgi:hypothetical protein